MINRIITTEYGNITYDRPTDAPDDSVADQDARHQESTINTALATLVRLVGPDTTRQIVNEFNTYSALRIIKTEILKKLQTIATEKKLGGPLDAQEFLTTDVLESILNNHRR